MASAANAFHSVGMEDQGQSNADGDQADVFDRGIGQQALHVALYGAVKHAEKRGDEAHHQRHHAPPPDGGMQQVEADPQQAVDGGLQHHAAHHRRHRRRRRRVRLGQPDMQRHQAGLGAKTGQRQKESNRGPLRRQLLGAHSGKAVIARPAGHDAKAQEDANGADVGDQQVEEAGAADFRVDMICRDQKEG